jgi:adenylate kinase family enzyme
MDVRRIHILGASGSGVSTLGTALSRTLGVVQLDTDDFFWLPTEPPFTDKWPMPERLERLEAALDETPGWVLSGSLFGWGDPLIPRFDLVVFLHLPPEIRMARTLAREQGRYGDRIMPGGDMHEAHLAFMEWSRRYDTATDFSRNLHLHNMWLSALPCPVLRIEGAPTVDESLAQIQAQIS